MTHSLELVYTAVDQVNSHIVNGPSIVKAPDTLLLDADGGVDSLTLVNLIAALEQLVFDETGKIIVIADEIGSPLPNDVFAHVVAVTRPDSGHTVAIVQ